MHLSHVEIIKSPEGDRTVRAHTDCGREYDCLYNEESFSVARVAFDIEQETGMEVTWARRTPVIKRTAYIWE